MCFLFSPANTHSSLRLVQYTQGWSPEHLTFFSRHFWHAIKVLAAWIDAFPRPSSCGALSGCIEGLVLGWFSVVAGAATWTDGVVASIIVVLWTLQKIIRHFISSLRTTDTKGDLYLLLVPLNELRGSEIGRRQNIADKAGQKSRDIYCHFSTHGW